jgi:rhodanese-related sulfurtransferase
MRKVLPFLMVSLMLTGCTAALGQAEADYRQITMSEAFVLMDEAVDYIILDVHTPEEYKEKHISRAINLPNEIIGAEAPMELPDKEQLIFVYCRSGNRSKQAAQKLADLGYTNIVEIGGINDWPGEFVFEEQI